MKVGQSVKWTDGLRNILQKRYFELKPQYFFNQKHRSPENKIAQKNICSRFYSIKEFYIIYILFKSIPIRIFRNILLIRTNSL